MALHQYLIHAANVIYLASYTVKNIRALRWLTIVGITLLIPYYLVYDLWAAAIWNGIFLGINVYRLFTSSTNKTATHSRASSKPMRHHEKSSTVSPPASGMCPEADRCLV